ncbi:MAG: DUF4956 domain-containing protein [Polyangiaceae bacterium]|nr:DUF4956 domain-containing protein [Polyangiaceae bacterium]
MLELQDLLSAADPGGTFDLRKAVVALLLAFGLGQAIAAVYMATFRGLSYSRATVYTMAMGAVISCMLLLAVGTSIAAGIGIAGGLTAVRFRTSLRDPRDIVFIFAALGIGMACGVGSYGVAITATIVFGAGSLFLHYLGHGARRQPDGLLRFVAPSQPEVEEAVSRILRAYCRTFVLVTLREASQGKSMEHAYQISVRSTELRSPLVSSLQAIPGIQDVALLLQEPTLDL